MPKYGIHHIVIKEALNELYASENSAARNAADIIKTEMSSAILGSIGPDLFFWGPDYEVVDKFYTLYKNIQSVVDLYNKIVQPIRDVVSAVEDRLEDTVEFLAPHTVKMIRLVLEEMRETSQLFKAAIETGILSGVLEGTNLLTDAAGIASPSQQFFQTFVPDLQTNKDETKWYWFDMLHYRLTGRFAHHLVNGASSNRQKAYAFGYLSHIATDVVGHPFVNQVAGTVYRLNVQRHVTAENFMDTWKFYNYYGESINQALLTQLALPETLPTDIGDLLFESFHANYSVLGAVLPHPTRLPGDGFYTRQQIDETYEVFYKVLKLMAGQAIQRPTEPFSGVIDVLSDALSAFQPPPSPPHSSSTCGWKDIFSFGLSEKSRDCYKEFFNEAGSWLNYLGELISWSIQTIQNLIDLLLSVFLSVPVSVLLAILYGIQLLCYEAYRIARTVLSMNGFVFPEPDELDSSVARNLITPFQCQVTNFQTFPSVGQPFQNSLVCPVPEAEAPATAAGFYAAEATPDDFIHNQPFYEGVLKSFAQMTTPEGTRNLEGELVSIGNAVDFTAWMIQQANTPNLSEDNAAVLYADWNLDADRGYGYKAWTGIIPQAAPFTVYDEEYTDLVDA